MPFLLLEGLRKGRQGEPMAQKTVFGWILTEAVSQARSLSNVNVTALHCNSNQALDNSFKKFWEIKDILSIEDLSIEDELCEEHFRKTHSQNEECRYIVSLPFKSPPQINIGQSRQAAELMLKCNESRLAKNPQH